MRGSVDVPTPPRTDVSTRNEPGFCQFIWSKALIARNFAIRPRAFTFIGCGNTRTRIRKASESDSLLAFLFATSLAEMHQSRRKTKLSLGKPVTATFAQVAVANFPVLRNVANTGRAHVAILLPRSVLAANL